MPQSRFPPHVVAAIGTVLLLLSGGVVAQGVGQSEPAAIPQPPGKYCECKFASNAYQAYSINGACTVQRYDRGRSCEFGFSGVGADRGVLTYWLGQAAYGAQLELAPEILARYLAFAQTGDTAPLSDSKFIEAALPVLARASLFREAVVRTELPVKEMNYELTEFSNKYSKVISSVFLGVKPPLVVDWKADIRFEIGKGYVVMDFHQQSQLLVLFFSDAKR